MKIMILIPALALTTTLGLACGGSSEDHHSDGEKMHGHDDGMHAAMNTTRIVKHDGVQVAFDLMTSDGHAKMAKMMKIDMHDMHDMDHHLNLTLMNLETKEIIKDVENLKITVKGPDGKVLADGEGHVMAGGGMHHHGIGFSMQGSGTYTVKAEFTYDGKPHAHEAGFDM